jgi:hypothetical protein
VNNTPRSDFTEINIPDIIDINYQDDEKTRQSLQIMLNRLTAINDQLRNEATTYRKVFNDADSMTDTCSDHRDSIPTNQRPEGEHSSEEAKTTHINDTFQLDT